MAVAASAPGYEAPEICAKCGGKCCKRLPGGAVPADFGKPLLENLAKALATGDWAIDWHYRNIFGDNMEPTYYIRPAIRAEEGEEYPLYHYAVRGDGKCIFLTPSGCRLPFAQRPTECRMLEPSEDGCKTHMDQNGKEGLSRHWLGYQHIIKAAAQAVGVKEESA